jgi:pimeloyl-ACP methyl ester carboxylesterase
VDVVVAEQWFSNVEIEREVRPLARFNDRLSAFARVIRFDKRGVGLSDPVPATALPTLEEWMDDLRAVLDDVGSEKAAIVTGMAGGFMACVFAATYPHRVHALVLIDGFARLTRADDYPWGLTAGQSRDIIEAFGSTWGTGMMIDLFDPEDADSVGSCRPSGFRRSWSLGRIRPSSQDTAATSLNTSRAQRTLSCRGEAACCGRATRMPCCARSSTSSRDPARLRDMTACSRRCSSPTSSAQPTARPRSETPDGESS